MIYYPKPLKETDESFCFDIFSVPILQTELNLDVELLTEFCFELWEKDNKGVIKSNVGGWQSDDIKEEQHPELQKLFLEIRKYISVYKMKVGSKKELESIIVNGWFNINERNDYNMWHIHAGNEIVFSGAYYIKVDDPQSGPIVFRHPLTPYLTTWWKMKHIGKRTKYNSPVDEIYPKSNLLLIFPSWLQHTVLPNNTNSTRISMSFNVIFPPEYVSIITTKDEENDEN